jgi:hypothetical protein
MAQIVVEMSGDEAKLYRAFVKIMQGQDQMEQGFKKVKKSSSGIEDGLKGAVAVVTGLATSWLSVETAINMVTAAQENYQKQMESAEKAAVRLHVSRAEFLRSVKTEELAAAGKMLEDITKKMTVPGGEASTAARMLAAQHVTGGDLAKSRELVEASYRYTDVDAAGIAMLQRAPAVQRVLRKQTGKDVSAFDAFAAEHAASQILKGTPASREEAFGISMEAGAVQGLSFQESMAFMATVKDLTGDIAGTRTPRSTKAIWEAAKKITPEKTVREGDKRYQGVGPGALTPMQRLDMIANDPKLAKQFEEEVKTRGLDQEVLKLIMGSGSRFKETFAANKAAMGDPATWGPNLDRRLTAIAADPLLKVADEEHAAENAAERARVHANRARLVKAGMDDAKTNDLLESIGTTEADRVNAKLRRSWWNPQNWFSGESPEDVNVALLTGQMKELRYGAAHGPGGADITQAGIPMTTDPDRLKRAQIIEDRLAEFASSMKELAQSNAEMNERDRARQNKTPVASPGEKPAAVIP